MPVTAFQRRVLAAIRHVRHPGSHVAGSLPLHTTADSWRISRDIDLFHDAQHAMHTACEADCAALAASGIPVTRSLSWSDTFRRAVVGSDADMVEIDWAVDAAWRYFPPMADPLMGWRLHDADLACNKALALAGRQETRDVLDALAWHRRFGLASIVWAACGKDPGFNPLSLLSEMRRNARFDPIQMTVLGVTRIDAQTAKQEWLRVAAATEEAIEHWADAPEGSEPGVMYLDANARMQWPIAGRRLAEQELTIHRPSIGGCIAVVRCGVR